MIEIAAAANKFLYLFADCMVTKGFTRTMICDLSRQKAYFIDNCYYDILMELKDKTVGEVAEMMDDNDSYTQYGRFVNYIVNMELGELVEDISLFPEIEVEWDHPSPITNAIIDIRGILHDFKDVFNQLADLQCEHLQIRAYEILKVETILNIITESVGKTFKSLTFILKYDGDVATVKAINKIVNDFTFVRFCIYGVVEKPEVDYANEYFNRIEYTTQNIISCESCGIINKRSFMISNLQNYMENTLFNGCLNRKISIDETGEIKNCPSMEKSYGNIGTIKLSSVLQNSTFGQLGLIKKDNINICKDCEYRRVCTDCRAYIQDRENIYSKPAKCNYDPYSGVWDERSTIDCGSDFKGNVSLNIN